MRQLRIRVQIQNQHS